MFIYVVVIILIIFLRFQLNDSSYGDEVYGIETKYLKIVCGVLILLAGLRGRTVGADTISYMLDYDLALSQSIRESGQLPNGVGSGYYFFSQVFALTGLSVHWWFGIVELLYVYAMYRFIQKYSQDKLVSILCFFTIGLYTFSLAGLKQTLSMGFAILAYVALDEQHLIKSIIFGLIAYWCHTAAVIFIFGLAIYFLHNKSYYYPVLLGFLILVFLFGDWLWQFSISLLDNEHYSELYTFADNIYSAWTFVFFLILVVIMAFQWKSYSSIDPMEAKIFYGMTIMALAFQSLATSFSTAFRVAYYFLPFICVLIPNCFSKCSNYSQTRIWKIGICAICIFWMLYTGRNNVYTFFWQK